MDIWEQLEMFKCYGFKGLATFIDLSTRDKFPCLYVHSGQYLQMTEHTLAAAGHLLHLWPTGAQLT